MAVPRSLGFPALLDALGSAKDVRGTGSPAITSIAIDSRAVAPGALFVALRGERTDGHRFIAQAVMSGAAALIVEDAAAAPAQIPTIVVPDTARALSRAANALFGRPTLGLTVAGVTGTNGKTTTVQMLGSIFTAAGIPAGTIGTIGARFQDHEWALENTTPLAVELFALFAQMRDLGARGRHGS